MTRSKQRAKQKLRTTQTQAGMGVGGGGGYMNAHTGSQHGAMPSSNAGANSMHRSTSRLPGGNNAAATALFAGKQPADLLELFDESNFPFFAGANAAAQLGLGVNGAGSGVNGSGPGGVGVGTNSTMLPMSDRALSMVKTMLANRQQQVMSSGRGGTYSNEGHRAGGAAGTGTGHLNIDGLSNNPLVGIGVGQPILTRDARGNPTGAIDLVLGAQDIPDFMRMIMSDPLLSSIPEGKRQKAEEAMAAATNAALPTVNEILRRAKDNRRKRDKAPAVNEVDLSQDDLDDAEFEARTLQDIKEVLESITDSARLGILAAAAKNGHQPGQAPISSKKEGKQAHGTLPSLEDLLKSPIFNNDALRQATMAAHPAPTPAIPAPASAAPPPPPPPAPPQETSMEPEIPISELDNVSFVYDSEVDYDDELGTDEEAEYVDEDGRIIRARRGSDGVFYEYTDGEEEEDEDEYYEEDVIAEDGREQIASSMFVKPSPAGTVQAPRGSLLDNPERLDAAVNELFMWIKAIIWTMQSQAIRAAAARNQAAAVAAAQSKGKGQQQ